MIEPVYVTLMSLISLLGIWILVFTSYRQYRVALFRQELFILRDSLFDDAAKGLIRFDDPAYCLLRRTMNGFIRYGHRLTLAQFVVLTLMTKGKSRVTFMQQWEEATRHLDPATVACLGMYLERMDVLVVNHLVIGSPEMMLTMVIPLGCWASLLMARDFCKAGMGRMLHWLKAPIDDINSVAAAYGL